MPKVETKLRHPPADWPTSSSPAARRRTGCCRRSAAARASGAESPTRCRAFPVLTATYCLPSTANEIGIAGDGRAEVDLPQHLAALLIEGAEAAVHIAAEHQAAARGHERQSCRRAARASRPSCPSRPRWRSTVPTFSLPGAICDSASRAVERRPPACLGRLAPSCRCSAAGSTSCWSAGCTRRPASSCRRFMPGQDAASCPTAVKSVSGIDLALPVAPSMSMTTFCRTVGAPRGTRPSCGRACRRGRSCPGCR